MEKLLAGLDIDKLHNHLDNRYYFTKLRNVNVQLMESLSLKILFWLLIDG